MEAGPEGGLAEKEVAHHGGEGCKPCAEGLGVVGEGFDEAGFILLAKNPDDECFEGCGNHPGEIQSKHIHRYSSVVAERTNLSE